MKHDESFTNAKAFEFPARYDGKNPRKIILHAEPLCGDEPYQEIAIQAKLPDGTLVADIVFGVNDAGEVRAICTTGGDGDGDHDIAVYPERNVSAAVCITTS